VKLPTRITVDGERIVVLPFDTEMPMIGASDVRAAIVSDTVQELETEDCTRQAIMQMLHSVRRRGITPEGVWVLGYLPVDDPQWSAHLAIDVARRVAAKLVEINGHVKVFILADSATLELV
jgi:hypothetical protein